MNIFKNKKKKNKKKSLKKIVGSKFSLMELVVVSLCSAVVFSVITGLVIYKVNIKGFDKSLIDIDNTYNKIIKDYYEEIDKQALADSAINGMMKYLDEKYSTYLDEDGVTDLTEKLEGEYEGIGVQIGKTDKEVVIVEVFEDSPAMKTGLKVNDVIIKVDDKKITEETTLEEVVATIKGKKEVKITVKRDGKEKEYKVDVKTLDVPALTVDTFEENDKKIGYIYLSAFSSTADKQFERAMDKLEDVDSLIVDVRGNTGGYLNVATNISSLFLKKGKVIYSLEGKNGKEVTVDKTEKYYDKPVAVLIDSNTASASEVVAAALKESYGAILIGKTSFGKGKVQQTSTLSDSTMVKYTTAKWYTPLDNSIDGVGLIPGISVDLTIDYVKNPGNETDSQLQKAIKYLAK